MPVQIMNHGCMYNFERWLRSCHRDMIDLRGLVKCSLWIQECGQETTDQPVHARGAVGLIYISRLRNANAEDRVAAWMGKESDMAV